MNNLTGTVHVVDDDDAVRLALDSLLRSMGLQVRTHATVEAFLARPLPDVVPSCVVLDVRLPGVSGLDLLRASARTAHTELPPTIVVTGHGDIPMSVQAMKAGAIEFLSKPFREADLLRAIEDALRLDSQQHIQRAERAEWRQRYASLTRREHEVLHLIVAGRLNKQIAAELGVSEVTVKLHRAQVMRKMGQDTLADLVRGMTRLGDGERTTGVHPDTPPQAPPYTKV
ncbi:response regulator transcription factor [Aquabacterium sp.]|uniref:response regulator transcription factor n=1 Tax=Aquabacterium sp. TaxID=1872578 RepID=UPI0035AF9857